MCGKIKLVLTVFSGILLVSCTKLYQEDRSIAVDNLNVMADVDKENDVDQLVVDLPIKLDSSSYIIFPIRKLTDSNRDLKISYKSRSGYENYLDNIIFQNIKTNQSHLLASDKIKIISYEQLFNTKREPEKIIIYQVIDQLPEEDNTLTITSLYIGTNDGKLFKKISKSQHHLTGWKYISETKKVYFKTIQDTDKNNKLDVSDKHNIYSVSIEDFIIKELLTDEFKIVN